MPATRLATVCWADRRSQTCSSGNLLRLPLPCECSSTLSMMLPILGFEARNTDTFRVQSVGIFGQHQRQGVIDSITLEISKCAQTG
jgi:hypothetical protein